LAGHFTLLLEGIAVNADRKLSAFPLLSEAQRHQLLNTWNADTGQYQQALCLHDLFTEQAWRTPGAIAVSFEGQHLRYGELNERANQLAHYLRAKGVGPDTIVGLCLERSLEMAIGLLGILKAGGAYLPLDPAYPPERLTYMLEDARANVVVTLAPLPVSIAGHGVRVINLADDHAAIAAQPATLPASGALPGNLAYVIYTSGSTGKPKGAMITHACVTRLFAATDPWFNFGPSDVWTLFHSYAFDFSVWEFWGALRYGGRVVIVSEDVRRAPSEFLSLLVRERVTVLNQTPSAFYQLIDAEMQASEPASALSLRARSTASMWAFR